MLRVTINGLRRQSPQGTTILDALQAQGIEVPTLCYDARLAPLGGCRLCLVELRGQPRPTPACTTLLAEGMEIATHTEQLEQLRRTQLRLLAQQYPKPALNTPPSNEFLRWVRSYGLECELGLSDRLHSIDDSHKAIHVDMSRCIQCLRCVRICDEVAGRQVWRAWNRGDRTEIRPAANAALGESDCVSCGACVDACPSGALRDRSSLAGEGPTDEIRTVCPYCGTGCEMLVGRLDGRLTSVRPVVDAPVNKGHLCVKGRYGWNFVHAPDRITHPMIRSGDAWRPVAWSAAFAFVANRLQQIIAADGPDAIGVLGSSRATNEENYLAQKFARVGIGTNNVDCCARVCHAPTAAGMKLMLGMGAATNSFDDIELARTILVCGANPTENHPVVGDRIRQAARRGAELIVIDPRRIELADCAQVHLQLRPGANIPLLNAMAHTIVAEKLYSSAVAPAHVDNWDEFKRFIADYSPEQVAHECGVDADSIRRAARIYATRRPAMCFHGLGLTEHVQGTEGVMCLVNLALLTGNIGSPGGGINPLRGQNNVQGAAHMGCDPGLLPGSASLAEHRERFQAAWRRPIPARVGLNLMQMVDAAQRKKLKALWVIGYDVALSNPNAATTIEALGALDLVIVQDLFMTETARLVGSVFFPACSTFEKDGTFMNSERRIQRVRKVIEPVGQSLADWQIICGLAQAMGKGDFFQYSCPQDIWGEIRSIWPAGAGITYRRLDAAGLQWPCPSEDSPGTQVLHGRIFSNGNRVKLRCVKSALTPECTSEEYPLVLNTGRALYQFNAGTMSGRSLTSVFQPTDVLQISPADADRFGIQDDEKVRIISRYGQATLAAKITGRVRPGELFATFQSPGLFLNRVTSPRRDAFVQTPEYKVTAVRIEPLGSPRTTSGGAAALRRNTSRSF